ncbi:MAG: hypothetical protein AB7P22_16935 [Vicinamibacterales bacterium]
MSDWFTWLGEQVGGPCAVRIEQRMFDLAASMIAGYAGGHWGVSFVGDVPVPELPRTLDARVTITNSVNGTTAETDRRSAAVALAYLAVNWRLTETYLRGREDLATRCAEVQSILADLSRSGALDASTIFAIVD